MPLIEAVWAKPMKRLAVFHSWLRRISESSTIYGVKLVALFLTFPVFQLHNLLFKIAYTIQQRELRRIGRKCARLGGEDYSLQFDNLVLNHGSISQTYHSLKDFYRSVEGRFKRGHGAKIDSHRVTS